MYIITIKNKDNKIQYLVILQRFQIHRIYWHFKIFRFIGTRYYTAEHSVARRFKYRFTAMVYCFLCQNALKKETKSYKIRSYIPSK